MRGDERRRGSSEPRRSAMQLIHAARAMRAVTMREIIKFVQQRGRLLSALVRPLMWLAVFAAGFYNVFGVSIIPPYKTYITYQVYIVPGLLGIILLFHGMQSSLSMVYDREMGVMRLLLTAPLPRWRSPPASRSLSCCCALSRAAPRCRSCSSALPW